MVTKHLYHPTGDPGLSRVEAERLLRSRTAYLAGPFFNPQQVADVHFVEKALLRLGVPHFSPRLEVRYSPGDEPVAADRAFWANCHHIRHCKFLVAVLTSKDTGTAWEQGYASALNIPVLGLIHDPKVGLNLMVHHTVDALVPLHLFEELLSEALVKLNRGQRTWRTLFTDLADRYGRAYWEGEIE